MTDEILVKGQDGKWYILKGEELLPYGKQGSGVRGQVLGEVAKDLPKGVSREEYERLEKIQISKPKIQPMVVAGLQPAHDQERKLKLAATQVSSHEEHPLKVELDELVDRVVKNVELGMQNAAWLKDAVLVKRFRTIVSARLRDVRDASETRGMLARDQKVGGMGLAAEAGVEPIAQIIEKAFGDFQGKWRAEEMRKIVEWKKRKMEEQQRKENDEKDERELQEAIVVKEKKLLPLPPSASATDEHASALRTRDGGTRILGGLRSAAPAVIPPKPSLQKPPAPTPPLRPTSPASELAGGRARPLPRGERERRESKITDIRPAPKLVGPLEELSTLTVEDFRKLGKTPDEGVAKIAAKIDLLGVESLVRKSQGIEAWRRCALLELYIKISHMALVGRMTPEAVIEQCVKEGKPCMTATEFHAIMRLNQKLRF